MDSKKTYFLDLQTLMAFLRTQSCELTTELIISGKRARGSIILKDGVIISSTLILHNGSQITGERAYQQLQASTQWQVQLGKPEEKKRILRQKRALDPALLQNFSLQEHLILRSVFLSIDGRRSIEEIKAQHRLPPHTVDEALMRLRMLDLIE